MKLKLIAASAAILCLGFTAVVAQDSPIAKRQAAMKATGGASAALAGMAKGDKPYDANAVRAALTTISTEMKAFPDLFPAGTETGGNTRAAPAIWEKNADFRAQAQKIAADADAALAALPANAQAIGPVMQKLGATCGTCHQGYRLSR